MTMQNDQSNTRSFRRNPVRRYGTRDIAEWGADDRLAFPAQSSVLDEDALRDRVASLYELPPLSSCRFLSRGAADVYLLLAKDQRRF